MKPVAIFRHAATEGPAYFATYLSGQNIPWRLVKIDANEPVPRDPTAFSGLAFMGGPMSVNDDLPWIPEVISLIRTAVRADVPVIGHCLGGQLLAKALGGVVRRNYCKEIGWGEVEITDNAEAVRWFGPGIRSFSAFHWHGETFSTPPGAVRIASSPYCENQAFVRGVHLGMQCHVEMTSELIRTWCGDWEKEVRSLATRTPSVQTPDEMYQSIDARVRELNTVADRLYARWSAGLGL